MRHARPDYERFQDPAGLIPEDEPVFLIRAKDIVGADAVRAWARLAATAGAANNITSAALLHADNMTAWRLLHADGGQIPDMPSPVVPT